MLSKEIIDVYSENHMKPTKTLCGQNVELLIVKVGGTYSCYLILKGYHKNPVHVPETFCINIPRVTKWVC
jgi:hypothetical protein